MKLKDIGEKEAKQLWNFYMNALTKHHNKKLIKKIEKIKNYFKNPSEGKQILWILVFIVLWIVFLYLLVGRGEPLTFQR